LGKSCLRTADCLIRERFAKLNEVAQDRDTAPAILVKISVAGYVKARSHAGSQFDIVVCRVTIDTARRKRGKLPGNPLCVGAATDINSDIFARLPTVTVGLSLLAGVPQFPNEPRNLLRGHARRSNVQLPSVSIPQTCGAVIP
jgi:hypothetical protein